MATYVRRWNQQQVKNLTGAVHQFSARSVRTDKSMDQPGKFKAGISEKSDRSSSVLSQVSVRTDKSMDQPGKFKEETDSESIMKLLAEDQFKCPLCAQVFTDPLNIPCGHCYCRLCITSHWKEPTEEGDYKCPQCLRAYNTPPELYIDGAMRELLKRARYSPVLPASAYARPEDVACDVCTRRKLKAVKFCLDCSAAYCEKHLQYHYKAPVLQKHRLTEPLDSKEPEKFLCLKHHKVLDVFCKTDQSHICSLCALLEHRSQAFADSERPSVLSSSPETCLNPYSGALESPFYRSPVADSTFPQMVTPPNGIPSGTSWCNSHDSDSKILKRRRHNESPNSRENMKPVRRLQFDDDEEEPGAKRSSVLMAQVIEAPLGIGKVTGSSPALPNPTKMSLSKTIVKMV